MRGFVTRWPRGEDVATTWRRRGDDVATTWRRRGDDVDAASATPHRGQRDVVVEQALAERLAEVERLQPEAYTFRLNVSGLSGIGGAFRGCLVDVQGIQTEY
jgi:hypothetical protein